jgi:hypothetical protein
MGCLLIKPWVCAWTVVMRQINAAVIKAEKSQDPHSLGKRLRRWKGN